MYKLTFIERDSHLGRTGVLVGLPEAILACYGHLTVGSAVHLSSVTVESMDGEQLHRWPVEDQVAPDPQPDTNHLDSFFQS